MKTGAGKPAGKSTKFGAMFKDKRVLAGLAAAGVLGLVVFFKRGGSSGTGSADDSGQAITPANYDSSGVDGYNAISQIGQAWGDEFSKYNDQLGSILDKLNDVNGPTTTTPVTTTPKPTTGTTTKPKPTTTKPKPAAKAYATVTKYTSKNPAWSSTLSGIASHYKTSVSALLKLNPNIKNANLIHPNQKIRVK